MSNTPDKIRDGDEVHAVAFNGGYMISEEMMKQLKIESVSGENSIGNIYGVQINTAPHLPYIYREQLKENRLCTAEKNQKTQDS